MENHNIHTDSKRKIAAVNTITTALVRLNDSRQPRDPETEILIGAEARTLGTTDTDKDILFVHGFIGTPNNFADLPDQVAAWGWHVRVMLLPGHGTSPVDFQQAEPEELEAAVQAELESLQNSYVTLVLLGHSMGGALSTIVAAEKQSQGLVLVAPSFSITIIVGLREVEKLADLAAPFLEWLPKPQAMQQVKRKSVRSQLLMYNWIPMKGVRTARALAEKAREEKYISKLIMPVMVIHSTEDKVTDPQSSQAVYNQIPAKEKIYHELDQSNHVVFWDHDRQLVKDQVGAFLQKWE